MIYFKYMNYMAIMNHYLKYCSQTIRYSHQRKTIKAHQIKTNYLIKLFSITFLHFLSLLFLIYRENPYLAPKK